MKICSIGHIRARTTLLNGKQFTDFPFGNTSTNCPGHFGHTIGVNKPNIIRNIQDMDLANRILKLCEISDRDLCMKKVSPKWVPYLIHIDRCRELFHNCRRSIEPSQHTRDQLIIKTTDALKQYSIEDSRGQG